MAANVRVSFGLVKDEVGPTQVKHNKEYKASLRAIGEIQGSWKVLEREAVSALKNINSEETKLERLRMIMPELIRQEIISEKRAAEIIKAKEEALDGTAQRRKEDARILKGMRTEQEIALEKAQAIRRSVKDQAISIEEGRRKFAQLRQEVDGTAARLREEDRLLASQETRADRLRKTLAALPSLIERGKVTREQALEIERRINEELDGTAAARERDARLAASVETREQKILEKARAIRRERARGNLTIDAARRKMGELRRQQEGLTTETRDWGDEVGKIAAGYIGVGQTLGLVKQTLQDIVELEKSRAELTQDSVDAERTFRTLFRAQDEDAEVQFVGNLGASLGFGRDLGERRQLFDTAQALAAGFGRDREDFAPILEQLLLGEAIGFDLEIGRELVAQSRARFKDDPLLFQRLLFAAGELSQRDPSQISQAARVFSLFEDPVVAATVATVVGDVQPRDAQAFVKGVSKAINSPETRRRLGLDLDAPEIQVLETLFERITAGGDLQEQTIAQFSDQLRRAGITEDRERQGIIATLSRFPEIRETLLPIIEEAGKDNNIIRRAFEKQFGESPTFAEDFLLRRAQAQTTTERLANERSAAFLRQEREAQEQALEFQRQGREFFFFWRNITDGDRPTLSNAARARRGFFRGFTAGSVDPTRFGSPEQQEAAINAGATSARERQEILEEMRKSSQANQRTADNTTPAPQISKPTVPEAN